jgi:hypothetical protein
MISLRTFGLIPPMRSSTSFRRRSSNHSSVSNCVLRAAPRQAHRPHLGRRFLRLEPPPRDSRAIPQASGAIPRSHGTPLQSRSRDIGSVGLSWSRHYRTRLASPRSLVATCSATVRKLFVASRLFPIAHHLSAAIPSRRSDSILRLTFAPTFDRHRKPGESESTDSGMGSTMRFRATDETD